MAGPYGEAGKEYWERSKNNALTSLKNNAPQPFTIPAPIQNTGGESAEVIQQASPSVDLSKIDFSQFGKEPEAPEDERNFFQKAVEAPVIKQVLDAISVFTYAGANTANNIVDTTEQVLEGKFEDNPLGAVAAFAGDIPEGLGQGLSGAFGGNREDARGYGSVIRRAQENITGDTESTAAKWVSGLGGFAGDVLLDPTTYIGVGAIKGVVKGAGASRAYGKSEKLAKEMASTPAMAEAADLTRTFVPGKYKPDVQARINEVATKRSTFTPLNEADALKFDSIRPSRKTVEVQKVADEFAPSGNVSSIREAATGRVDAFKAAYADSVNTYRLSERSRKLANKDKRAARAEYRRNPDAAIARMVTAPYQSLVSVANTATPTAALAIATDIVHNTDDILGVTRSADEVMLDADDLVEAAKNEMPVGTVLDDITGANAANNSTEIPGQEVLFTPNEVREGARVDAVEQGISVERTHADTRNTGYTSEDFWNGSPIPGQQSFDDDLGIPSNGATPAINGAPAINATDNVVADGIDEVVNAGAKPVKPVTPEDALKVEASKPGNVMPQEVERAAEDYVKTMDNILSTPEGVRGMRLRAIKEQQAQDVALILGRAELPMVARDPAIREMRSTYFYPKHTIDAARKLNAIAKSGKIDPTTFSAHLKALDNGGVKSESFIKASMAVMSRGDKNEIAAFAAANKPFKVAYNRSKAGVPNQAYISLGVHPSDVKYAKDDALQSTVMVDNERSVQRIITHMRNLVNSPGAETRFKLHDDHPLWRTVEELEDVFNVVGVQEVIKALRGVDRTSVYFKEAEKFANGIRVPNAAHRGITQLVGEDTVRAALNLAPVDPETMANVVATVRNSLETIEPGFAKFVDDIIIKRAKIQATPVGKNRTTRTNSSTDGAGLGARTNDQWNSHALMGAYQDISYKIYKSVHSKNMKKKDDLTMASMRYFDNTLRQQGIDFHLTDHSPLRMDASGKATGEVTVRLGLSDILDAIGPELRAQFWHAGTMKLLPSQLLGLGEDLVRSARHIDPITGTVDINRARLTVAMGLKGKLGSGRVWEDGTTRLISMDESVEDIARNGNWVAYREVIENTDNDARRYMLQTAVTKYLNDVNGKRLISKEEAADIFAKGATKAETRVYDDVEADIIARLEANEFDGASLLKNAMDEMNGKVDELVEALFKTGSDGRIPFNKIVETALDNAMLIGKNIADTANKFAKADVARIEKALMERNSSDLINAVTTESGAMKGLAPEVKTLSNQAKSESMAKALTPDEVKNIRAKAATAKALTPENANAARVKNLSDPEVNAEDIVAATKAMPQVDAATAQALQDILYDAGIKSTAINVSRAMGSWGPRFNNTSGFERSASLVTSSTHTISALMDSVTKQFQAWKKAGVNAPELNISLNVIKNTVTSGGDLKTLTGVDKQVYEYFNVLFDTSKYNFFTANGIKGAAMNRFKFNLNNSFGDTTKGLIKFDEKTSVDEISRLWTQLPINDPYSFTSKLFYVYAKTVQETTTAAEFSRNFGKAMSPEAAKAQGYVKIVDTVQKDNIFARMIDGNLYYPREMADESVHINKMMNTNRAIANQQMQTFMENIWDPVISVLKMGQTSIKPGHHVMSVMGDWWRNLMLTGSPMTHEYKQAAKMVMYLRQMRKNEAGVDTLTRRLDAAMGNEFNVKGDISEIVLSVYSASHKKVMPTKFNMAELVTLGEKHGVFFAPHSGGVSEDLLSGASAGVAGGRVKTVTDKLLDNRMTGMINKFSADRDGLMRGALFLHYMQSKRFNSLEDAANFAGNKVREAAPVAADLAAWESKYMRRGVFYYTWLRGITPRILETLITKPGLAMIPSKGMYELAEANGLNPNSFGDPMSEELKSNLPDYYAERVMGPAYQDEATGDYWGFSSTSPTIDVLNTFGSNIAPADFLGRLYDPLNTEKDAAAKMATTFVGMVTPWAKYPIEMATGKRMDTGAPIESNIQYLQDQNAISRTISKVTGKNIDGLNRTETKYRNGMEDASVMDVFKPHSVIGNELTNFFTGGQFTNYSAPNIQKAAEFQTKEKATEVQKLLDRMGQNKE